MPLDEAIAKAKPKVFTRNTLQLYYMMLVSMMLAWANGYDGSLMSGINAMPQYQKYFGASMTGGSTGIVFAIYPIGFLVGSPFTGPVGDLHGFMAGRFLCGFGIAVGQGSGVTYAAEIAHPAWRSAFTSMYNTFYFVGAMIVAWVTYGTLAIKSDYAWRVPVYLQAVAPALVLISAPFLAESPRWLLAHGRQDDAQAMLAKYHGDGNSTSPLVGLEMREMVAGISLEGTDKVWWDYRALFNSHEARWRIAMVIGMAFIGQWAGNASVTYFAPVMLKQAGVKSSREQILYVAILNTLSYPCAAFAAIFIAGRFGRRTIFITASLLFCLEFIIITAMTAIYSKPQYLRHANISASKTIVAFIFLFRLTYSLTFTPLHPVYPIECLSFETRAKGAGFYAIMDSVSTFFNTYVTPIGLGRAGWKFYFLYIIWNALIPIVIYLFAVETHGRTLEELTDIFRAPNPRKASTKKKKVIFPEDDLQVASTVVVDEGEVTKSRDA
ncbi:hypothetical protein LTR84_010235 [Exophiala bonariae]|uniref:Major facilitator superfamily (MFS) profile domain-containing protein n=1 Tax=Exophiala bonariae TaxID=1690606 RepID=A0AAV9MWK7_9EURO|nr:hypothetical protein LTR84_010235 [Exophiala bonariae]